VQHYDDHYVDDWRPPPDINEDEMWGDEWFFEAPHEREKGFVRLDAHIMGTPAIADIDGDGQDEIVVAASYFFDPDYYDDPVRPCCLTVDAGVGLVVSANFVHKGEMSNNRPSPQCEWTLPSESNGAFYRSTRKSSVRTLM
jgi:hypothetical protein